ncbi:flavodoxin domain-containing protein [Cellulomonas sp. P22]|uniref:flavodoxin domain-containing protein n=1 Tax=Cellulomonas sp. P22 TaxID=3373189 RepID=UPI003791A94A
MPVLVAYATKYGATRGIAEHVARELTDAGHPAETLPAATVTDLSGYTAVIVGSAVFAGRWHRDARDFVRRHGAQLRERPVWLFSSGPLGTATHDKAGKDLVETSQPLAIAKLVEATGARGTAVFFGALDTARLDRAGRLVMRVPAARDVMVEGDFRDWPAIAAWARGVASELSATRG